LLTEVAEKIYLLTFKDAYQVGMHFWRYQEHYECPSLKFRGKYRTLLDYMSWYATTQSDCCAFTYPSDWQGYNIPGNVLAKYDFSLIPDFNQYDEYMLNIIDQLRQDHGKDFYLIGAQEGMLGVVKHEIAHGLFYTNKAYRKEMKHCLDALSSSKYEFLKNSLISRGYTTKVIDDEIQAYCSTGLGFLSTELENGRIAYKNMVKPFKKVYKKYYEG